VLPSSRPRPSLRDIREYTATIGAADGNIIAAIITTHTPVKKPSAPGSVLGPMSMPLIRPAVTTQATPASASSAPAVATSGSPGERRRES
jgi:hypothetical protein